MRAAARQPSARPAGEWGLAAPPCRFLTGAAVVHQTIFCVRSFEWACGTRLRVELYGDGTLGEAETRTLLVSLPGAVAIAPATVEARLDRSLPSARYPTLRQMRTADPRMRKLLDLHAGLEGPSLYLDSDMLFFAEPRLLIDWLRNPSDEWVMAQAGDAMAGARPDLEAIAARPLLGGVNSGILALFDEHIDWLALERFAAALPPEQRVHPWAEQTLFALHLSRRGARPLPRSAFALCHGREDLCGEPPPLRHYVHKAKALYTAREWRRWLERSDRPPTVATPAS